MHQLVLPVELRATVLRSLHDDLGHLGIDRTLDLVRSQFYWPKMSADVEQKIKTCERCVRRKTPPERAAPMLNIVASRPLELVCMDTSCSCQPRGKEGILHHETTGERKEAFLQKKRSRDMSCEAHSSRS